MLTTTQQRALATANPTSVGLLQRKCAGCKDKEEQKKRKVIPMFRYFKETYDKLKQSKLDD